MAPIGARSESGELVCRQYGTDWSQPLPGLLSSLHWTLLRVSAAFLTGYYVLMGASQPYVAQEHLKSSTGERILAQHG